MNVSKTVSAIAAGAAILTSAVTTAQENSRFGGQLEEVLVTARRVEESMQTVPVSVTSIDGEEFTEIRGAQDLTDVSIAPNVDITSGAAVSGLTGAPTIFIRGLGQADFLAVSDPAVGVYLDGVYISRTVGSLLELTDFERIEVLRGPQGTLYGRNTEGGAINLITRTPGEELASKVTLDVGGDDYLRFKGSVDVPFGESAGGRFTVYRKEIGGYVDILQASPQDFADGLTREVAPAGFYDGYQLGEQEVTGFAAKLRFGSGDVFSAAVGFDYTQDRSTPNAVAYTQSGLGIAANGISGPGAGGQQSQINAANGCLPGVSSPPQAAAAIANQVPSDATNPNCMSARWLSPNLTSTYLAFQDRAGNWIRPENEVDTTGLSLTLGWDFDGATLKSITAFRDLDSAFYHAFGPAPFSAFQNFNNRYDNEQLSQEFQLSGNSDNGRLSWVTGLYFFEEEGNESVNLWRPNSFGGMQPNVQDSRSIDNTSTALFGQITYGFSEAWELTLGYRYSDNEKNYQYQICNDTGVVVGIENCIVPTVTRTGNLGITESNINLTVGWNAADNIYAYASFADGFRDGGFPARFTVGNPNLIPTPMPTFDPEFVDSFEIGLKADWLDGRLRTNFAAFLNDYQQLQGGGSIPNIDPGIVAAATINKGDATFSGFEAEILWSATDNLRFDLSLGLLDAEYDCVNVFAGTSEVIGCTTTSGLGANPIDITVDAPIPFAAEVNGSIGVSYSANLNSGGEILTRVDWRHTGEQWASDNRNPDLLTPAYDLLSASVTYFSPGADWSVSLGARNLGDEEYFVRKLYDGSGMASGGVPGRPRYAYLGFRYEF